MSRKKAALVFLAGAVFGISLLIVGGYLWFSIADWLPYARPDAALIAKIERLADQQPELFSGKPVRRDAYRRWYVQGRENDRDVIWGEWDKDGKPAVYLGHRRFPPNLHFAFGGGCGWVHLRYDLKSARLDTFMCNAPL